MTRQLPLRQELFTLIDAEDFLGFVHEYLPEIPITIEQLSWNERWSRSSSAGYYVYFDVNGADDLDLGHYKGDTTIYAMPLLRRLVSKGVIADRSHVLIWVN